MKVVVVTPTYNEKENIAILIPRLQKAFKGISHDMHILVLDDKSPDGTANVVKKLQKKYKNLHLLLGNKQGLGVAYLRGFKHASTKLKADVMIMMDADLSHPPEMIPQFIDEIDKGADLVIGSRYIRGGATPDWGLSRRIISRGGNFFARIVAGMYKTHDCTSGYRAIRTNLYKTIDESHLHTRGYAFMSTLLYELVINGAQLKEIPLVFYDRTHGKTKLEKRDMYEFFFNALRLRLKSSKRMLKFMIVGGSGIFVNLGIFATLNPLFGGTSLQPNLLASLLGDEISIVFNFFFNHFWTFKNNKNNDHLFKKLIKFNLVAVASVFINNTVLYLLTYFMGTPAVLAKFIGILVAFLWNYLLNVKWTWREKIE